MLIDIVHLALVVATKAHKGQFRHDGVTPYIEHPKAVASMVTTDEEKAVALLHDVVEDTDISFDFLALNYTFPTEVLNAVDVLTHKPKQSYEDYLRRVVTSEIATRVKIADMFHNLSDAPRAKQKQKYLKGLKILLDSRYREKDK